MVKNLRPSSCANTFFAYFQRQRSASAVRDGAGSESVSGSLISQMTVRRLALGRLPQAFGFDRDKVAGWNRRQGETRYAVTNRATQMREYLPAMTKAGLGEGRAARCGRQNTCIDEGSGSERLAERYSARRENRFSAATRNRYRHGRFEQPKPIELKPSRPSSRRFPDIAAASRFRPAFLCNGKGLACLRLRRQRPMRPRR